MQVEHAIGKATLDKLPIYNEYTCLCWVSTFCIICCLFSNCSKSSSTRLQSLYIRFSLRCDCSTFSCARTPRNAMKRRIETAFYRGRKHLWIVFSFNLYSALMATEQGGFFSVQLWHRSFMYIMVVSEDSWHAHLLPSAWQWTLPISRPGIEPWSPACLLLLIILHVYICTCTLGVSIWLLISSFVWIVKFFSRKIYTCTSLIIAMVYIVKILYIIQLYKMEFSNNMIYIFKNF